ncbi:MAG TPA: serine protease [Myxococcaceae bacterium]|nr:serine protease [Myxococcaceae bacterium]
MTPSSPSRRPARALLGLAVAVVLTTACHTISEVAPDVGPSEERALSAATVTLLPERCQGVVVQDERHVLTASHCLEAHERAVRVRLHDGRVLSAQVAHVDRPRDIAVLQLTEPSGVKPLQVAPELPFPGSSLRFISQRHLPGVMQEVVLERLGRCPSLPGTTALFTSLRGRPGDSGAPVVDLDLQVVGLVHGGAACRIATPIAGLGSLLASLGAEPAPERARGPVRVARKAPPRPRP